MAGVVAALRANDHLRLGGEKVDDLAFAFVAPLAADQDDDHPALVRTGFGPAGLQVVEAGVVAAKLEFDHPGGTVAVLGEDDFGDPGPLVRLVVLGPVKKHDDVAVLLDGSTLSK